jgi:hypothetical protein
MPRAAEQSVEHALVAVDAEGHQIPKLVRIGRIVEIVDPSHVMDREFPSMDESTCSICNTAEDAFISVTLSCFPSLSLPVWTVVRLIAVFPVWM